MKTATIDTDRGTIRIELAERLSELRAAGRLLEAQRLEQRTLFDLEMLEQTGHCKGIENYSRHLTGRAPGEPPPTLIDYLPANFLLIADESHVSIPQVAGMWRGDRSRKETLVEHGFRLPSALDNRPLRFAEFQERIGQAIYVSATPGPYELERITTAPVEQIIRPTGLLDPRTEVRPVAQQVDDLLGEIRIRAGRKERVLVTTLTKRMAEHLTEYYQELGVRVRYMHSDIDTLERMEILRDLRAGLFDVLVGINLLREGLDLPEVSLVAILDADKEGFLRSHRSLIQTIGRASRNADGQVIMYADRITDSMRVALEETRRRRALQEAYNIEHGVTPRTVHKAILSMGIEEYLDRGEASGGEAVALSDPAALGEHLNALRQEMWRAAQNLDFERAASLRDQVRALEEGGLALCEEPRSRGGRRRGTPRRRRPSPR